MLKSRRRKTEIEVQRLQMTPLIDVVFLLLTFFIMTFKIVMPEGEFAVKMPQTGDTAQASSSIPLPDEPIRVRMIADAVGNLADIQVGSVKLGPQPGRLREYIIKLVGPTPTTEEREKLEAILDPDRKLKYQYTFDAWTEVSGYLSEGQVVPLIDKISFADKQKATTAE